MLLREGGKGLGRESLLYFHLGGLSLFFLICIYPHTTHTHRHTHLRKNRRKNTVAAGSLELMEISHTFQEWGGNFAHISGMEQVSNSICPQIFLKLKKKVQLSMPYVSNCNNHCSCLQPYVSKYTMHSRCLIFGWVWPQAPVKYTHCACWPPCPTCLSANQSVSPPSAQAFANTKPFKIL